MPIYEYVCETCGNDFERLQSFSDEPLQECPQCRGHVRRVISSVGVIFKGSGWYITDSRRQLSAAGTGGARKQLTEGNSGASDAKADGATSDSTRSREANETPAKGGADDKGGSNAGGVADAKGEAGARGESGARGGSGAKGGSERGAPEARGGSSGKAGPDARGAGGRKQGAKSRG